MSNQTLYAEYSLYQLKKTIRTFQTAKNILFLFVLFGSLTTYSQQQCDQIRINQVGYYPNSSKLALITCNVNSEDFYIVTSDGNDTVYQGTLGDRKKSAYSSTVTRIADFSLLTTTGSYILRIDDRQSFPFEIKNDVYTELGKAVLKSFYYQRSSIPLEQSYAGKWNRGAKKTGDVVIIQPSTYSDARGSFIASPGGWYDRGDYDKYIVSSGITMSTLLSAYEDFTNYFDTLHTNIPESGNKVPDVLNEIIYNLRWMFTMQDPFDGGVYGKCVNAKFEDIASHGVSSDAETVHKSTGATLDFAAVMAQAGRIFRRMQTRLPGLSDSCLRASANAWIWAVKNPDVETNQALPNKDFKSAAYHAKALQLDDEWLWAASEMFVTSKNRMYFDVLEQNMDDSASLPTINNVGMLAYYSMLRYADNMPSYSWDIIKLMRDRLLRMANRYLAHISANAFYTVMGQSKNDFTKGSNSVAANQAILLINAYLFTGNEKYVSASMTNLDYLLGRNATGYCFVTGCFGMKSPVHPYYRISNDIDEPVPGLLVAGPCSRDKTIIFSSSQDIETSYQDSDSGADANQVSIDWNSSMVYLVNAVEAMQYELGFSRKPNSTIAVNR